VPSGARFGRQRDARPVARPSMPNVLYIVWDDAAIAAWNAFGGLIDTPSMRWLAARGLRYSQWHTTAVSSSTRSSLLTGRDRDADAAGGGPDEPDMIIPSEAATLAEILGATGYRTYCVGKWHLSPAQAGAAASARGTWPLARGFDRYYGFLGSATSQWYPDLVYDDRVVDPPYSPAEGYHLSRDLADMAMEFIADGTGSAPGQPWLCYLAFGANGAPREWARACRDRFAMGYDRYREIALGNMKRLGVVPEDTRLAPADRYPARPAAASEDPARPWQSLSEEHKQIGCLLAESAAACCSFTDHQIGRLLGCLEESGLLRDTIVVACSAGAAEAGQRGEADFLAGWAWNADAAGDAADFDHLSAGWARAFGTPYNVPRHCSPGGSATPLIISWAPGMQGVAGGIRDQYHHAVDIVPTILDCAGIEPPLSVNGRPQQPLHGVSMRYTFTAPEAPSARRTQFYRAPGSLAVYHDGWKAVTAHRHAAAGAGRWELYHVSADRAETRDVAASYPEKVAQLAAMWRANAIEPGRQPGLAVGRRRPAQRAGGSPVAG